MISLDFKLSESALLAVVAQELNVGHADWSHLRYGLSIILFLNRVPDSRFDEVVECFLLPLLLLDFHLRRNSPPLQNFFPWFWFELLRRTQIGLLVDTLRYGILEICLEEFGLVALWHGRQLTNACHVDTRHMVDLLNFILELDFQILSGLRFRRASIRAEATSETSFAIYRLDVSAI